MRDDLGSIVVAGSLVQKPRQGGHTWVFLQYLLGFRRLGWEVLFIDRLGAEQCVDAAGRQCRPAASANVRFVVDLMERFGLTGSYAVLLDDGATIGLPRAEVVERTRCSALLLNVMGFLDDEALLGAGSKRVFLDIDPGFGQMWHALGLADPFRGHELFVTIGENIGQPDCAIPTCGLDWITTPQPIVLAEWPVREGGDRFTSVASWRGAYGPVEYGGTTYGLRVHELRKFAVLPRLTGQAFELALDIHPAETSDLALLDLHGWSLVDPKAVAGDPWSYRAYIQGSRAELMVAKQMYVRANSGWFSDRSICYLASGKPVVAQDTGFSRRYPADAGLLAFSTLDEAAARVEQVTREYDRHAHAARHLAEAYFDSDVVLPRLLARLGVA